MRSLFLFSKYTKDILNVQGVWLSQNTEFIGTWSGFRITLILPSNVHYLSHGNVLSSCMGEPRHMGCAGQLCGRALSHGMCWAIVWASPVTWDLLGNCMGEPCHMGCAGQLCG